MADLTEGMVTIYGGAKLTFDRATKGTIRYQGKDAKGRTVTQYVPKDDMPQVEAIMVIVKPVPA
jgi:hypothetical protein